MNIKIKNILTEDKDIVEQILLHRGKTKEWLDTKRLDYHSATSMKNFDRGYELIKEILSSPHSHKIGIYVDSDTDGMTSSAIQYLWLKDKNPDLDIQLIVPEGKVHGIIKKLIPDDLTVLIVPDASSSEGLLHLELMESGLKILILDHHEIEGTNTSPAIIINPHQPGCSYENKDLSGAGVVFKFIQAIDINENSLDYLKYADLASVGIVADVMDLSSLENKGIVNYGTTNIKNKFLIELCRAHPKLQTHDKLNPFLISFYVAPVINATIRMGELEDKVNLVRAMVGLELPQTVIAKSLSIKGSQDRKKEPLINRIVFDLNKNGRDKKAVIIAQSPISMPRSLTGLISGQLADLYSRPAIIGRVTDSGEFIGSARSLQGTTVEFFKDFCENSGLFNWVAGHQSAFGLSIPEGNIELFIEYCSVNLPPFEKILEADYALVGERTAAIFDAYSLSEHFCKGFETIYFYDSFILTPEQCKIMGEKKNTLKFTNGNLEYIAFNQKNLEPLTESVFVELIGKPSLNEWNGRITAQLMIEHYEFSPLNKQQIIDLL